MSTLRYSVRKIDAEEWGPALLDLHDRTFGNSAPRPKIEKGMWWLVFITDTGEPVAFAGMEEYRGEGYMTRCGVTYAHRGHGLQRRLIKARVREAKRRGWTKITTDTNDNIASSNNLIREGFKLFKPRRPWSYKGALYWKKQW